MFDSSHQCSTGAEIEELFHRCDLDGDGVLDWCDFVTCASDKRVLLTEFNFQEAFASFDHYQKNLLTFDDLRRLFERPDQIDGANLPTPTDDSQESKLSRFKVKESKIYWSNLIDEGVEAVLGTESDGVIDYAQFKQLLKPLAPTKKSAIR